MRTGIFTWLGRPIEMNTCLKLIKNAGFDSVLLGWSDEHPEDKQPELVYKNGLQIESAHLPIQGINTLWEDSIDGEEYANHLLQLITECADYTIPTVVLHLSQGKTPPPPGTTGLSRFQKLVDFAEKRKINIALENVRCTYHLDYVFQNISSPRIGVCYDSGHNHCFAPSISILREHKDRIIATHLHDNDGVSDLHMIPFDGTIDWSTVKNDLALSSFSGALSLEVEMGINEKYKNLTVESFLSRAHKSLVDLYNQMT